MSLLKWDTHHVAGLREPGVLRTHCYSLGLPCSYSHLGLCRQCACPSHTLRHLPLEGEAYPTCRCVCEHTPCRLWETVTEVGGGPLRPGSGHWEGQVPFGSPWLQMWLVRAQHRGGFWGGGAPMTLLTLAPGSLHPQLSTVITVS